MTSFTINNYKVPLFTINKISLQKSKNTTKK